jgi:hypothetical protein
LHGNRRARAQPKKAPHGATASASNFNTAVSVRSAHVSMSQGPSRIRRLGRSHAERDSARADERPRLVLSQPPPQPNQAVGLRPNRADHPRRRITPASVAIDRRWGSRSDERGTALGLILRQQSSRPRRSRASIAGSFAQTALGQEKHHSTALAY